MSFPPFEDDTCQPFTIWGWFIIIPIIHNYPNNSYSCAPSHPRIVPRLSHLSLGLAHWEFPRIEYSMKLAPRCRGRAKQRSREERTIPHHFRNGKTPLLQDSHPFWGIIQQAMLVSWMKSMPTTFPLSLVLIRVSTSINLHPDPRVCLVQSHVVFPVVVPCSKLRQIYDMEAIWKPWRHSFSWFYLFQTAMAPSFFPRFYPMGSNQAARTAWKRWWMPYSKP